MGPVIPDTNKSWKEINKTKKEQRKKWKEEKLLKKMLKADIAAKEGTASILSPSKPKVSVSTISIAVPGSILDNAQSPELRTYLAGQIARAACIFKVDEVVVFDDNSDAIDAKKGSIEQEIGSKSAAQCCVQLARILQYLECPQYLRKHFFPIHNDLKFAGVLNPLDAPHHLRQNNNFKFREGVVSNKPIKPGKGSMVNVGLLQDVTVDKVLSPGLRVTVQLKDISEDNTIKKLQGTVVPPTIPQSETGVYWGYTVRVANNLSQVFSQAPYDGGYDLTIGTSDKGTLVSELESHSLSYQHAIVVFGGLHGIEAALESDVCLSVDDPSLLFDHYINTIPNQGSRTIRTEEAVLLSMAVLVDKLDAQNKPIEFVMNDSLPQSSDTQRAKQPKKTANTDDMTRFD